MPENKKHHYVPKFYLKRFSKDGKGINLFNIKSGQKVIDGKLKNQCYKNYFYGQDQKVEKALGVVDDAASRLFKIIEQGDLPPPIGHVSHHWLLNFVAMQLGRTKLATDMLDDMIDKLIKEAYGDLIEEKGVGLDEINIKVNNAALRSLSIAANYSPLLLDMDIKILDNTSSEQFILSDSPVVCYN